VIVSRRMPLPGVRNLTDIWYSKDRLYATVFEGDEKENLPASK
jgi:hypothetical protein